MGLVLDEQNDSDKVFNKNGLNFLVGDDLEHFEGFSVDYSNSFLRKGFSVNILGYAGGMC
ncbi:MAG: hypothetical protein JXQ26_06510 [Tissierellales bacterium]|nr:hypothetical protein [Tissierellales bacterium]MBN2827621.1 hypothetical protein [Tissierellales bacterium]